MLNKYHKHVQYQLSLKMNKEKRAEEEEEICFHRNKPAGSLPLSPILSMSQPNRKSMWFTYGRHTFITFFMNPYELRDWHKHIHPFLSQTPHVDQGNGNQLWLEHHKETSFGSSVGSQLPRACLNMSLPARSWNIP